MQETRVRSLGREDPLEKEMATRSSILAWKIPWTEEPGGLQSMPVEIMAAPLPTHAHSDTTGGSEAPLSLTAYLSLDLGHPAATLQQPLPQRGAAL